MNVNAYPRSIYSTQRSIATGRTLQILKKPEAARSWDASIECGDIYRLYRHYKQDRSGIEA
ncbi:MAG: hypothetical protein GXP08_12680 [Gammaproteobacteria bacterium]|nr:hypothetical protein [Gammaproteobacteria bacterium]